MFSILLSLAFATFSFTHSTMIRFSGHCWVISKTAFWLGGIIYLVWSTQSQKLTSKSGSVPLLQLTVLWVLSLLLPEPETKMRIQAKKNCFSCSCVRSDITEGFFAESGETSLTSSLNKGKSLQRALLTIKGRLYRHMHKKRPKVRLMKRRANT